MRVAWSLICLLSSPLLVTWADSSPSLDISFLIGKIRKWQIAFVEHFVPGMVPSTLRIRSV